jgi:hypothetical protein
VRRGPRGGRGPGCLAFAEGFAGRKSVPPRVRDPHLGGIDPLAAGMHGLRLARALRLQLHRGHTLSHLDRTFRMTSVAIYTSEKITLPKRSTPWEGFLLPKRKEISVAMRVANLLVARSTDTWSYNCRRPPGRATAWVWRLPLAVLVAGLAVINAPGVYAQLVAAHVGERGEATSAVETRGAALAARIDVTAHNIADLDRRLGQIDLAIEEAAKRGKTNATLAAIDGQRKARAGLVDERKREAGALGSLASGARHRGREGPANRDGGRTDQVRGRDLWYGGSRDGNPVADRPYGAELRSACDRVDRSGVGTAINRCLKAKANPTLTKEQGLQQSLQRS